MGQVISPNRYFIFPPWAQFTFRWEELPAVFPYPEKYGLGAEVEKAAKLGYSVGSKDHRFFDGPEGGGLIAAKRDTRRWFPMELMRAQCTFEPPPGFTRGNDYGINIMVPKLRAAHRLGQLPIPAAPSPLFSVEPISGGESVCFVAFGFDGKPRSPCDPADRFPSLGLHVTSIEALPNDIVKRFKEIEMGSRSYKWYSVVHGGIDPECIVAACIYIGLGVAGRANGTLRVMHIFCDGTSVVPGYTSATRWHQSIKRIQKATDW